MGGTRDHAIALWRIEVASGGASEWFTLSVLRLRDMDHLLPRYPGAEHHVRVTRKKPLRDGQADPDGDWTLADGDTYVIDRQFHGMDDATAVRFAETLVAQVVAGDLPVDREYAVVWHSVVDETARCCRMGRHVLH